MKMQYEDEDYDPDEDEENFDDGGGGGGGAGHKSGFGGPGGNPADFKSMVKSMMFEEQENTIIEPSKWTACSSFSSTTTSGGCSAT